MQQQRIQILRDVIEIERRTLAESKRAFVTEPCADNNEIASFNENINMMTLLMQRTQERLRSLESLITNLTDQPNNLCYDCGEEIAPQRLLVRPDTMRCRRCQEEWEDEQQGLILS